MKNTEKSGKPSYWATNKYYIISFVGAMAVFAVCAWLVQPPHALYQIERDIFETINNWPDRLRLFFIAVTMLGSVWMAAVSVVVTFVLHLYQLAWRLALSVLSVGGLQLLLKELFERPRPEDLVSGLVPRVAESGFAFPSTHTAIATVLALTLLPNLPRGWRWVVVVAWIAGVALSRIYLGVHAPLDVIAGFAVGVGIVCFWRVLPKTVKRALHLK